MYTCTVKYGMLHKLRKIELPCREYLISGVGEICLQAVSKTTTLPKRLILFCERRQLKNITGPRKFYNHIPIVKTKGKIGGKKYK